MAWAIVLGLIILGLALLMVEFVFIPGTTVVGFVGLACAGYGVYLGYSYFGNTIGTGILMSTSALTLAAFYFSLKSGVWEKFALKGSIKSKVNEDHIMPILGDIGVTVSSLRPLGKADFDGDLREVASISQLINSGVKVRVVKVEGHKIWVEEAKEFQ